MMEKAGEETPPNNSSEVWPDFMKQITFPCYSTAEDDLVESGESILPQETLLLLGSVKEQTCPNGADQQE